MSELEQQIIAELRGPNPPLTVADLVRRCGVKHITVMQRLSTMLSRGLITRDELSWRRDKLARTKAGRPKGALRGIQNKVKGWIEEGGKDRVQAARLLADLQQISTEQMGPPEPNDRRGTIEALKLQLLAVGKEWADEAYQEAFPSEEASNLGQTTSS